MKHPYLGEYKRRASPHNLLSPLIVDLLQDFSPGLPTLLIYQDSPDFKGPLLTSCFLCYISLLTSFLLILLGAFWHEISCLTRGGSQRFKHFPKLMKLMLSLPRSNASAERIFSMVEAIKTDSRNRLLIQLYLL